MNQMPISFSVLQTDDKSNRLTTLIQGCW